MEFELVETTPSPTGGEVVCKIEAREGRGVQHIKGEIALDFFDELDIPKRTDEPTPLSHEQYAKIEYAMKKTDAVREGLKLLAFAQNNKRSLYNKLVLRGFSRDAAGGAVEYLSERGYINEEEMARALALDMAERRMYGKIRIRAELMSKGFSRELSERATAECGAHFERLCAKRIEKLGGIDIFEERDARAKAVSSLIRYGFTMDDIRNAARLLSE